MSRKLNYIPRINSYEYIRKEMYRDLQYRLGDRMRRTSLGRPLYERMNVQVITTQECPYNCPFCIERKNPMEGQQDFDKQVSSLVEVLREHRNARVTITGGEPSLYPEHVRALSDAYKANSNNVFLSINTAGFDDSITGLGHINLSVNKYVRPDISLFHGCTYQTVFNDEEMTLQNIREVILNTPHADSFSFRFISSLEKHDYDVSIWNSLQDSDDVKISTFRIGDFFVYATFDFCGKHARVTLGDMNQQRQNNYADGYSNIIIHPSGEIRTNWR